VKSGKTTPPKFAQKVLLMHTWLQDYAYRIEITWVVFILSGLIAGLIAIITISYQSAQP
jgi:hypothetical protein